ncbi:hypothetical protein [Streptomyces sp. NPDC001530]|uniref:hypothetical protein n=1 Tax=Streptomyces sp. NPDC001530 TaxID=3364582 RepID=UPI00367E6403
MVAPWNSASAEAMLKQVQEFGEEERMRVCAVDGVTCAVLVDGRLDVYAPGRAERYRCSPVGAAMWIALRQNGGHVESAVNTLADVWGTEPEKVRVAMTAWCRQLTAAGLLRTERLTAVRPKTDDPGARGLVRRGGPGS